MAQHARLGCWLALSLSVLAGVVACGNSETSIPEAKDPQAAADVPDASSSVGPTYHKDVAPLLQGHCQKCHAPGGVAPFSLLTFADARAMSPAIVKETAERRMPPWGAQDTGECKPRLPWNHDERLSEAEIATLAAWDAAGAPEGDPREARAAEPVAGLELTGVTDTLVPRAPFTASGDRDQFRCFVLEHPYPNGAYVTGIHVLPGNKQVVHHAVVFTDPGGRVAALAGPDGSFECSSNAMMNDGNGQTDGQNSVTLDVWTPGNTPIDLPSNIAIPLTPGSKLVMQIHYSPGGAKAAPDLTKVQLRTSAKKPEYLLFTTAIGNAPMQLPTGDGLMPSSADRIGQPMFEIPRNVRDHVERMQLTVPPRQAGSENQTMWIYGVMAHQHLAGIDVKVDLERGSDTQCLLQDRWDFHWQRMYTYAAPVESLPTLAPGDRIKLRCTYDNSMANRRLGPAYQERNLTPMELHLGEETLDEMCLVIPQLLVKHP